MTKNVMSRLRLCTRLRQTRAEVKRGIALGRACGAGHILAILGRAVDERRTEAVHLFGEQVIPILRRA